MERFGPTIRQIQYFIAIAETLSFNQAAKRLNVGQPTLTTQIVAFEESLGLQLFERSRAGTMLTAAGRDLLPNARRVIEEFQGLTDQAASVSRGPSGTYRLGVTPTLGPYLLPHILPVLHQRATAHSSFPFARMLPVISKQAWPMANTIWSSRRSPSTIKG